MNRHIAVFMSISPVLAVTLLVFSSLAHAQSDPLPSWNDTAPKKAVVEFVERVTTIRLTGLRATR